MSAENRSDLIAVSAKGGLVRGFGMLGVADYLYEKGQKLYVVAGSSSGAIAVASLAAGYKPKEAIKFLSEFNFWSICSPQALLRGSIVDADLYEEKLREIFGNQKIENLPTPLVVFATDPKTGQRVYLTGGDLVSALMASSSYSPVFPKVTIDGRRLKDGDFTESYSAAVLKNLGAEFVIGVAYEKPNRKEEDGVDIEIRYPINGQSYIDFKTLPVVAQTAYDKARKILKI